MTLTGMNVAEVRQTAQQLRQAADQLRQLVSSVDGRVTGSSWVGPDASTFKNDWWPQHRQRVLDAAERIAGLGQSASNNADEQERVSSTNGGGSLGAVGVAVGGAAGVVGGVIGGAAHGASQVAPPLIPTPRGPQGPGSFANSEISKAAEAHAVGSHGGQCRAFVSQVVSDATGGKVNVAAYANPAHDYFTAFEQHGTRMTDVSQLRPGDIVQVGEFESNPHLHTFIIDGTPSQKPDGTWSVHVIDSNSQWNEQVRAYDRSISLSDQERAYRLGTV